MSGMFGKFEKFGKFGLGSHRVAGFWAGISYAEHEV